MRGIFTTLAVCSFAAASFAATLMPASGVYYPSDINNSGVIHVEFNDSVAAPTATISVNGSSVSANMFEEGSTGRFWAIEVQEALQNVVTTNGKAMTLTVKGGSETVTGSYTYMPVFPLTSIAPENYSLVEEKTFNAVFTFDQNVSYTGATIVSGDKVRTIGAGSGTTITIPVKESDWATITTKQNSITVQLNGVTLSNGSHISNVSGATDAIAANYFFNEKVAIQFLGVNPDPADATYQEVYDGYWYAGFMFNDEVSIPESGVCAVVTFYDEENALLKTISLTSEQVFGGWNYRGGYYSVDVEVPAVPSDIEELYYSVKIQLANIKYNNVLINPMPSVTYEYELPDPWAKKMRSKGNTASLTSLEAESTNNPIYNINGTKVADSIDLSTSKLAKGVYVVGGKKMIIR